MVRFLRNAVARIRASLGIDLLRYRIDTVHREAPSYAIASAVLAAGLAVNRGCSEVGGDRCDIHHSSPQVRACDIDSEFARLRALAPSAYPVWRRLFENGAREYEAAIASGASGSLSDWSNFFARVFGAYVRLHGRGPLLDVGSGNAGIPSYLAGYCPGEISLMDPLLPEVAPPCEFVQGFGEFLPWPDETFSTVVSATSLDHALDLDASLAEAKRVLVSGGRLLVWLASIDGATPFEHEDDLRPADDFHLFHFNRAWIEPIFGDKFIIEDVTVLSQEGFDHVFYCLRKPAVSPE